MSHRGVLLGWRARVAAEAPSHLRAHPDEIKVTLLAAYLYCRRREIIDALVDLLITTVQRINARADTRVTEEFVAELKRVSGKENILFKMTQAALEATEETISEAIYPVVPGGVDTLVALWHEYQAKGSTYRQHRQRVFKASYTNQYRTGLIQILEPLEFGSTNTVHAPMMTALALIKRYKSERTNHTKYYAVGETVPVDKIVPPELAELMYRTDEAGRRRILRSVYECGVFQTLRDKLRCKEIWVHRALKSRNPDDDLPQDYEERRVENYAKLRKPLDAKRFTGELIEEMDAELSAPHDALPSLPWLQIVERKRGGAIVLSPLEPLPEPRNLRKLKAAIRQRWGVVPLLDMFTETALRTGCLDTLIPAGTRIGMEPGEFLERMLLVIYAYGTGAGIRSVASGEHPYSEEDLRYSRRRFLSVAGARQVAKTIANATFAARQSWLWGEGTTAVASDSTHFSAFDQNIVTEYHSRYKRAKRGVLIYWTVETGGSMAIYSQHLTCSASEVHAMVEGAMRHETDMTVETNYVDSHGASIIGFGVTRLLNFDLVARFKQVNIMKLYLPGKSDKFAYPLLGPALTRPIRPEVIENNYDLMIKYATAIRQGTASTEALLRRFTGETTHPAYSAMYEVGCAQRTIFLARWLRDRDLQHETESGLNVVENYNGVNDYIRFGKRGELASNRREEQELGILCLTILQSSLAYINTLMIQDTVAEPAWADVLTDIDRRGLTPLFHTNMTPYGTVQLRPDRRLDLTGPPAVGAADGTTGETSGAAIERFLESITAATTRAGYAETLTRLTAVTGPEHPVAALAPEHYAAVMDRWKTAAAATWNRHLSALASFTTWAQRQELPATNPARRLERRKPARRGDRAIPRARLETLFTDPAHALRERLLWRLLYDTAARAEEILTLNVEDLDLEFRRARVVSKGGAIEYVHWATPTARLLPRLLAGRTSGPVFLADRRAPASGPRTPAAADIDPTTGRGRLSYPRAEYLFKTASAELDPHRQGWTLHQLRHSASQHLAQAGRTAPELQAKSRHQHLASLGRYVRLGEETSARVTAEADPIQRRRPR